MAWYVHFLHLIPHAALTRSECEEDGSSGMRHQQLCNALPHPAVPLVDQLTAKVLVYFPVGVGVGGVCYRGGWMKRSRLQN